MTSLSKQELAQLFRAFMPASSVVADEETKKVFECDGLAAFTEMPLIVLLPETVDQVQKALKICYQHEVPVVARGAGTGLSAGSTPHKDGVLLAMTKFSNVLNIDADARLARLQPGVRNLAITEAASPYGLYYAPDPSSQIACTVGGNVAENAGGVHCLKYGLTVHNLVSVQMVTIDGEIITLGNEGLDSYGPDLLALITGSEGLLGVITEITVRLLPIPEQARVVLAGFETVPQAGDAVAAVIAQGIIPGGLEMMDGFAIRSAEDFAHAGYPVDAEALLLCEVDGSREEVDAHIENVVAIFKQLGATSVRVSQDENERALMWKGRKSAFPAVGRISPDYYCMDGTIPRGQLSKVLTEIHRLSEVFGLRVANVFHAGDGNLHPLILFDASVPGEFEKTEAFGRAILDLCVEVGGCITGEHGVGLEKLRSMISQFKDEELAQFHKIKQAFDPNEQLNPGKGVPLLKNCQEYRALSVSEHAGACEHE